jgi:hypothetical protein
MLKSLKASSLRNRRDDNRFEPCKWSATDHESDSRENNYDRRGEDDNDLANVARMQQWQISRH